MDEYNHRTIEPKWQKRWLDAKIYQPDLRRAPKPFYNLMMFPYPSAEGLHVGNMYAFTGADIYGRFKRMQGYDVFEPIGLDGFGIYSENYAIRTGEHPARLAARTQRRFYEQLQAIGNGFAWEHRLETYDPVYYRWTQWIFVQLFKRGLAYRASAPVNWCPGCQTVLADEQVVTGECERCSSRVEMRDLEQWFFKITAYAERLLDHLDALDWSDRVKSAQRHWIGRESLSQQDHPRLRTSYRLRDWLISRQRYWGPPIPMISCPVHGWVPVPEEELPVLLPETDQYRPSADGRTPLGRVEEFIRTRCPVCGGPARRSDEVSDTFLDSAWYFLRYLSVDSHDRPWDPERMRRWLPVDMYIAGAEHSVLHLLYTRFLTMALHDMGLVEFEEPFTRLRAHGLLIKGGAKMSKSRGNVIVPDDYVKAFGADTLRTHLMFIGPFDQGGDFQDTGLKGIARFLRRVWALTCQAAQASGRARDTELRRHLHDTIRRVGRNFETLKFNTGIAAMMEFVNVWESRRAQAAREIPNVFLRLLAPVAPHMAEELWVDALGESFSIHHATWPAFDEQLLERDVAHIAVLVNGKLRDQIAVPSVATEEEAVALALARPKVRRHISGSPRRTVYVPGRVLNIVT